MVRRSGTVSVDLPASAVHNADEGETFDGEVLSPAEADAERIEREGSDDVLRALSALDTSGECRWQIDRVLPAADAGYLFELTTPELTLQTIKVRAGAGKYRATGFKANGQYAGRRTFSIAKELDHAGVPGTSVVPQSQTMKDYFDFIERNKIAQKEELKFWAGLLLPLAATLLPLLFNKKESGIGELVTALKGLKGMTDEGNAIDKLKEVKELLGVVREVLPEEGSKTGSTWADIARDALPVIGQLAVARSGFSGAGQSIGMGAPGTQGGPRATIVNPALPQNPAPPQKEENPLLQLLNWFRAQIPWLVQRAAANKDAGLYAEVLADGLPANIHPTQLKEILSRPDWWQLLSSSFAEVRPYQVWFTALRNELIQMVQEAEGGAHNEEPNPGENAP